MNRKILFVIAIVVIVAIGIGVLFFAMTKNSHLFKKDTTISGTYTLPQGSDATIENGSTLTTTGDMNIDGTLSCANGPLSLSVEGDLHINGILRCVGGGDTLGVGIRIVATHIIVDKNARIETDGHIVIVNDETKMPLSQETISALYGEASKDSGDTIQVGPFGDKKETTSLSLRRSYSTNDKITQNNPFIKTAFAHTDSADTLSSVELRGTWDLASSPLAPHDLFLLDMGANSSILMEDLTVIGASGQNGKDDIARSCTARGGDGNDGTHIRINAGEVTMERTTIELGDGGNGGSAKTSTDCKDSSAQGGNGGEAGNMKITATKRIAITTLHINPGRSGDGGNADAVAQDGKNSCPGEQGGDAHAQGGNGGANKKDLQTRGGVDGIQNIQIDRVIGGNGGDASAKAGNGGISTTCTCVSGNGGASKATGGNGGDASVSIPLSTAEGRGGDGGNSESMGGNGGDGLRCSANSTKGANGGSGESIPGLPGKGTSANGNSGTIKLSSGGNGGAGGDGCPPSEGGSGGTGSPLGKTGRSGNSTCVAGTPSASVSTEPEMIQAIIYKGKYLPVDQLIITNEPGCGEDHWRAERGVVSATDGSRVPDADVVCGFGKVSEVKPVSTTKNVASANADNLASTTDIFKVKF